MLASKVICDNTYVLKQVIVNRRPGYISIEADVPVFGVGTGCGLGDAQ